jgi:transposase
MPKPYPTEFRARAVTLVKAGKPVTQVARDLGISAGGLQNWIRQDRIDRGEVPGVSSTESRELRRARKRIRELEREVEILRAASRLLGEDKPHLKESTR